MHGVLGRNVEFWLRYSRSTGEGADIENNVKEGFKVVTRLVDELFISVKQDFNCHEWWGALVNIGSTVCLVV